MKSGAFLKNWDFFRENTNGLHLTNNLKPQTRSLLITQSMGLMIDHDLGV